MKTQIQQYKLWTYDVWGNARDGFEVNDRYGQGIITIRVKETIYNQGTPQEFSDYSPTDLQLSRAVGACGLEWDGESDYTLYATCARSGKPVCELDRQTAD